VGEYRYTRGVSVVAIVALVVDVLPSLPGFLEEVKLLSPGSVPRPLARLYHYAWFIGFAVAFVTLLALSRSRHHHPLDHPVEPLPGQIHAVEHVRIQLIPLIHLHLLQIRVGAIPERPVAFSDRC